MGQLLLCQLKEAIGDVGGKGTRVSATSELIMIIALIKGYKSRTGGNQREIRRGMKVRQARETHREQKRVYGVNLRCLERKSTPSRSLTARMDGPSNVVCRPG